MTDAAIQSVVDTVNATATDRRYVDWQRTGDSSASFACTDGDGIEVSGLRDRPVLASILADQLRYHLSRP